MVTIKKYNDWYVVYYESQHYNGFAGTYTPTAVPYGSFRDFKDAYDLKYALSAVEGGSTPPADVTHMMPTNPS